MKFAYADPPYIGQARKHYRKDPRCAEVDHPVCSDVWHLEAECSHIRGSRPTALCRGTPICEDYRRPAGGEARPGGEGA